MLIRAKTIEYIEYPQASFYPHIQMNVSLLINDIRQWKWLSQSDEADLINYEKQGTDCSTCSMCTASSV